MMQGKNANKKPTTNANTTVNKKKYEDFPLSLALFDALPVLFFSAAVVLIGLNYKNSFFITGSILCTLAGVGKVLWKIIIAATKRDIVWMNRQLRILMPAGFLLIIIGIVTGQVNIHTLKGKIFSLPSGIFFGIALLGMVLMSIFAVRLDGTKLHSNWIEQITNAVAQGCFLLGVICLL